MSGGDRNASQGKTTSLVKFKKTVFMLKLKLKTYFVTAIKS